MITKLSFIALIILITSCSTFVNTIDDDLLDKKPIPYKEKNQKRFCQSTGEITLLSETKENHAIFKKFIEKYPMNFTEKLAIWTFVQMNERPDRSSPTGGFQIIIGKDQYFYFHSKDKISFPVLYGLSFLLDKTKRSRSLSQLAALYDKHYPKRFFVSKDFSRFLLANKEIISKNQKLNSLYKRADESLRENERVPNQNISKLISIYKRTKSKYIMDTDLFKENNYRCSFDIKKYKAFKFEIQNSTSSSHTFGITSKKDKALIALTSDLSSFTNLKDTIFFHARNTNKKSSACIMANKYKRLWLFSSQSRDPSQSLAQLINLNIFSSQTKKDIALSLDTPRHLVLNSPKRIILEAEKMNEEQKQIHHNLNIPMYNAANLGNISVYFRNKKSESFILDTRDQKALSCR